MKTLEERLLEKVVISKSGCWLFTGFRDRQGYGEIRINNPRKMEKAHRTSYKLFIGNIPNGMCVLHKCDNPPCCNPKHLFLGTKTDNAKDRDRKGRTPKGEDFNRKLSENDVRIIKYLLKKRVLQKSIANRFGVCHQTISDIKRRRIWKHIPDC